VTPFHGSILLADQKLTVDGSTTSVRITGLTNGVRYRVRVLPWNDGVAGRAAISSAFEPNAPPQPPTVLGAWAGEQSATVRWRAAAGGGPVESYRVAAAPAHVEEQTVTGSGTSALVGGLRNRSRYTFTVTAVNGSGASVSSPSSPVWPGDDIPGYLFVLELTYLLVLLGLAFAYALHYQPFTVTLPRLGTVSVPALRDVLPPTVASVPISIPWFGALGAVLVGLYGVFGHGHRDWQRRYNLWHIARPFTGSALAMVAFMLFVGVIRAVGVSLNLAAPNAPGKLIYFTLAFIVGFREETFRTLVKRVDVLLGLGRGRDRD
jgi:hypothetical protein